MSYFPFITSNHMTYTAINKRLQIKKCLNFTSPQDNRNLPQNFTICQNAFFVNSIIGGTVTDYSILIFCFMISRNEGSEWK